MHNYVALRDGAITITVSERAYGSERITMLVPKRPRAKAYVAARVRRFVEDLGHSPRVLVGKRQRVLTGIRVYADV